MAPGRSPSRAFPPRGKAGTVGHHSVGCKFVERNLKISLTATVTSGGRRARRDTNRAAHVVARHRRHGPVPRGRSSTPRALPSRTGGLSLLFGGDSRRLSKSHRAFRGRCPKAERGASPWRWRRPGTAPKGSSAARSSCKSVSGKRPRGVARDRVMPTRNPPRAARSTGTPHPSARATSPRWI